MISNEFEHQLWIYFQTNLTPRTRKEYWKVIKDYDRITGHDPMKLFLKDAKAYYTSLTNRVTEDKISYSTAVMRLSVMRSICDFIENYQTKHGKKYTNYFREMRLAEPDKILQNENIPTIQEIDNLLEIAEKSGDFKAFLIFSLVIKCGLTNSEICSLNREHIIVNTKQNLCIDFPVKKKIKRVIALPKDISSLLDNYIADNNIHNGAIFLNSRNNRIKQRDIERLLGKYTSKLKDNQLINKHFTMQSLRHAAFAYMLKGGATKEDVALYGGITTKWMNRYDRIIEESVTKQAAELSIISVKTNTVI